MIKPLGPLAPLEVRMPDPLWRRIAEDLRQKIESGELGSDGRPLPSELELREQYEASRNTIRDAVKWLITRGLVVTRPGQGTFVRQKIDPFVTHLTFDVTGVQGGESTAFASEVQAQSRRPKSSMPRVEIQNANEMMATELEIPVGETVVSRHQERYIDEIPWSLQTTFYPMQLVLQGATELIQARNLDGGAVPYIEETIGIKRAGRRDRYKVRAPDRTETGFFGLPDDGRIAVLELTQALYDESRRPFAVTITTYPADRNQFVMTLGNAPAGFPEASSDSEPD
jgi:GntR family transcriptional regulator